jgi:hypothetical protein
MRLGLDACEAMKADRVSAGFLGHHQARRLIDDEVFESEEFNEARSRC